MSALSTYKFKHDGVVMDFPAKLPKVVPAGSFLVHNSVRPSRRQGVRWARFWLQTDEKLERCPCDWAPELGNHYLPKQVAEARRQAFAG